MEVETTAKVYKLGDLFKITSGGTPSRKNEAYFSNGNIPWIKTGDLKVRHLYNGTEFITKDALQNSSAQIFPKNTVLVALYGATIGACSILKIEAATNQACAALLPSNKVNSEFLYFYFLNIKPKLIEKGVGGGQPNISGQILKETEILLPEMEEQNEIVRILEQADGARQKRKQANVLTEQFLQSAFLNMFADPVKNEKEWDEIKFAQIGTLDRGRSKHRPRNAPHLLGGKYPLIQTGEISNSGGYIKEYTHTYSEAGLKQSKIWKEGTLCITIAANIAKTGILTFDACFPDSVVGFIPNEKTCVTYVQYWLSFLQKMLEDAAPESAQKNINLDILRKLNVPLPPISLQQKFAQLVEQVEKLRSKQRESEKELEGLFQSLMQRYFG